ncbi:probable disease resistance protein At4g27220 [Populus alba]|uniref:probable disease resistance protein At4g27220 n=1 Tax=Populus alba TaxID=43335 RepID=UPI00158EBB7D|nr:probable disease resistance protein At4g14610 [Populus alba]
MNALKAADVKIVGVYGMGGEGKTTLVKEVSKQAIEDKLFDKMVIASVTRNPDTMKIQGRIADQLGLTFNEERHEQNECKTLLTPREFDVLSSEMGVDKNFSASVLKEDEAWELFKKTAGGDAESPDMRDHRFICAQMRIIFSTVLT